MSKHISAKQQSFTDPELVQKALYQLLEQITKRDQKILSIAAEKKALEDQLHQILNSKAWKIASRIQQIRSSIVPPQSRRAQVLEKALNIISFYSRKL
jgi:hypothetical protein